MDSLSNNNIEDCREHLINETDDDFEVIDLIGKNSSNAKDKVCIKKKCVILVVMGIISVLLLVFLLMSVASAAYVIVLFESGNISKYIEIDTQMTEAGIVPGHYVLVQYDIKENTVAKIIGFVLKFSLNFTSSETQTNYTANVYKVDCSSSKQVQPFHQLQPVNRLINFTDCPNQICPFDQYVYQVASNESKIVYSITNNDYNKNESSEFLILAYQLQLASSIKSTYMTSRNLTFTLDNEDIRKSTYYFFGIQLITGPPITNLTITRFGVHVFYNASHESPVCTFNASTSCSFTIGYKDASDCIFTYFTLPSSTAITDNHFSFENNDPYNKNSIPYSIGIDNPTLTTSNYFEISGFIVVFTLVTTAFLCLIWIIKKQKKRTSRDMTLIRSRSIRWEEERSLELTASGEEHRSSRKSSQTYYPPQVSSRPNNEDIKWISNLETIEFNEKGVSFRFNQYGPIVVIPEGAVEGCAYLQYGVSHLYTPGFRCEEGSYEPVSSFVYMHIDKKLLKPVRVYIPIDVICDDTKNLVLLCKGQGENVAFKVRKDVLLSLTMRMVCFELSHFCEFCIANDKKGKERKYNVVVFIESKKPNKVQVDLVIMCSIQYLKKLEDYYKKKCTTVLPLNISLTNGLVPSYELPEGSQWKGHIKGRKKITFSDVDVYKFLQCDMENIDDCLQDLEIYEKQGSYPPRFNLVFEANTEAEYVTCTLIIKPDHTEDSATPLHNCFEYDIELECELQKPRGIEETAVRTCHESFIKELYSYIKPVISDWYFNFGLELGISVERMNEIEQSSAFNIEKCIPEILREWQKNSASLKSIPEVLKSNSPIFSSFIDRRFPSLVPVDHDFTMLSKPITDVPISDSDSSLGFEIIQAHLDSLSSRELQAAPEFKTLIDFLRSSVYNWKMFGMQVGLRFHELEEMDLTERGGIENYFARIIEKWENKDQPPFTWETVIKALYAPSVRGYLSCEKIYKFLQTISQEQPCT